MAADRCNLPTRRPIALAALSRLVAKATYASTPTRRYGLRRPLLVPGVRPAGKAASKALSALERQGFNLRQKLSAPISRVPRRDPPKRKSGEGTLIEFSVQRDRHHAGSQVGGPPYAIGGQSQGGVPWKTWGNERLWLSPQHLYSQRWAGASPSRRWPTVGIRPSVAAAFTTRV